MRRYLLTQARAENESKRIGAEVSYLSMFDKDPPTGLDLLVVDEAQHDSASRMAQLHQRIQPRFILGLSATPYRSDRVKLCFDTVIRDAGIQTLIQDGYLSPYHHYTIPAYTPKAVVGHYLRDRGLWGVCRCLCLCQRRVGHQAKSRDEHHIRLLVNAVSDVQQRNRTLADLDIATRQSVAWFTPREGVCGELFTHPANLRSESTGYSKLPGFATQFAQMIARDLAN